MTDSLSELERRVRERARAKLREKIATQVANVRNGFPSGSSDYALVSVDRGSVRARLADDRDGGERPVSTLRLTSHAAAQILVETLVAEGAELAETQAIDALLATAAREEARHG